MTSLGSVRWVFSPDATPRHSKSAAIRIGARDARIRLSSHTYGNPLLHQYAICILFLHPLLKRRVGSSSEKRICILTGVPLVSRCILFPFQQGCLLSHVHISSTSHPHAHRIHISCTSHSLLMLPLSSETILGFSVLEILYWREGNRMRACCAPISCTPCDLRPLVFTSHAPLTQRRMRPATHTVCVMCGSNLWT